MLGSNVTAPPVEQYRQLKKTRLIARFIPHVTSNLAFNTSHSSGRKEHHLQSDPKFVADAQKRTVSGGNELSRKVPLRGVGLVVAQATDPTDRAVRGMSIKAGYFENIQSTFL
jgi:hypothetical protein